MDDGAQLRTWTTGSLTAGVAVVLVHGGPGLPDYLAPVAGVLDDMCLVHRYDQRGVGGSRWDGHHTIGRHLQDLVSLLNAWAHGRVVLVGHSFGANLVTSFMLAHPDRVAGVVLIAGPFLNPWREDDRAAQRARRSDRQQARLDELDVIESRTEAEDVEFLALSWFTDHDDQSRAWEWTVEAARTRRPINYAMNAQVNAAKNADPVDAHVDELRALLPPDTLIIGGAGDSRPAHALRRFAESVDREVVIIADAGHEPWLEQPKQFADILRATVERQTGPTNSDPAAPDDT